MKLLGRTGRVAGRDITVSSRLRIGAAEDNDFRLVIRGVSRHHARIVRDGAHYWLEDAGSTNGTFLNGQRITRERIDHLDVITLGRDIDLIAVAAGDPGVSSGSIPLRSITEAWFEWIDGPEPGGRVEVPPGEITIGRVAPSNVLVESKVVSQIHCRIMRAPDQVLIQDLDSANGTYVNAKRITEPTVLRRGDVVSTAGVRQFRMHVVGDTSKVSTGNLVSSGSLPALTRDWQTRLVWSADELAQLEAERRRLMDDVQHVKSSATGSRPMPVRAPEPVRPPRPAPVEEPRRVVATKPEAPPEPPPLPPQSPASQSLPPQSLPPQSLPPESLPAQSLAPQSLAPDPLPPSLPPPSEPVSSDSTPSLAVAKQAPGPKSVIPFVPPAGSLEFREAETQPLPRAGQPPETTMETVMLRFRGLRLSGAKSDFEVGLGSHLVGRADDTAITIRNPQVSRHHAVITTSETGATIEDLKSANGTFLNMQRVQAEIVPLNSGDILAFGSVEYTVELLV